MLLDESNTIFKHAVAFVQNTNRHVFVTGKAGTGKTTFLKYIKSHSLKKMIVTAPTGVAAINAGGVTIHSFFQLPFGSFYPDFTFTESNLPFHNKQTLLQTIRYSTDKRTLLEELEVLIIDEVSMVRADLLDAIDWLLRHFRRKPSVPFGGVQMVFIGDLHQLPPIIPNEEWIHLKKFYSTPFFFESQAVKNAFPVYLELEKIYRQADIRFIDLLNNVRNNRCSSNDFELLHQHYHPLFIPPEDEHYVTLTSHNHLADNINKVALDQLQGKIHKYPATIIGDFNTRSSPAEEFLLLKEGAQVMFIKNDKGEDRKYFNGKIGVIHKLEEDVIEVKCSDDTVIELQQEVWRNIKYHYNKEEEIIEEEELGTFSQYPVRLAWAITIHKSQGLTFDKAIIDAGAAFAPGQVYVALSRLTNLSGLVLKSPISKQAIMTDERAIAFSKYKFNDEEIEMALKQSQSSFVKHVIIEAFSFEKIFQVLKEHIESYPSRKIPDKENCIKWAISLVTTIENLNEVGNKFCEQLSSLFSKVEHSINAPAIERTKAASIYFSKELEEKVCAPIIEHIEENKPKKKTRKYIKDLHALLKKMEQKKATVQKTTLITMEEINQSSQL